MAVTLKSSVALYDPLTNTTFQVLTSPESSTISSAHFLGDSGRHLVAVGVWDVVLWDLVTRSGMFFRKLSQ